jgi:predicted DCC family thiol-disulfide oxidoreductase YuxK
MTGSCSSKVCNSALEDDGQPVEVFYNSACPVCRAGMDEQRSTLEASGLAGDAQFTDMTVAPDALASDGLSLDHVRRHFYVRDSSGNLHRGADAAAVLWRMTPGRRWLGWLISRAVIRPLARLFYDWFADRLYNWNRRKGRW